MLNYSDFRILHFHENELEGFQRPYVGNGYLGVGFDRLLAVPWNEIPPNTLAAGVYDETGQVPLPSWTQLDIIVNGNLWQWQGPDTHNMSLSLDTSTGEVRCSDRWEYEPGRFANISISLLIPRSYGKAGMMQLNIDSDADMQITFGINGVPSTGRLDMMFSESGQCIHGNYTAGSTGGKIIQKIGWSHDGAEEISGLSSSDILAQITLGSKSGSLQMRLRNQFLLENENPNDFLSLPEETIKAANASAWNQLWQKAIDPEDVTDKVRTMTRIFQFYLLSSLNTEGFSLGPLGLSAVGWGGMHFWDCDLWLFRPILQAWPAFAASLIDYRYKGLAEAKKNAEQHGLKGALFDFKTDMLGRRRSHEEYSLEIHVNVWIALMVVEYFKTTKDLVFVKEKGWGVLHNISLALLDRGQFEPDGKFHIRGIIGADEAMVEIHNHLCDDSFMTNYGVKKVFEGCIDLAGLLGESLPDEITVAADNMFLPEAENGIFPEYQGYAGEGIKQADMILAMYPLGFDPGKEVAIKNVEYYHSKIMEYGPLMTSGIEACIMLKYGMREQALKYIVEEMEEFCDNPFMVVKEAKNNHNTVFLTGVGTFLHVICGITFPGFLKNIYQLD